MKTQSTNSELDNRDLYNRRVWTFTNPVTKHALHSFAMHENRNEELNPKQQKVDLENFLKSQPQLEGKFEVLNSYLFKYAQQDGFLNLANTKFAHDLQLKYFAVEDLGDKFKTQCDFTINPDGSLTYSENVYVGANNLAHFNQDMQLKQTQDGEPERLYAGDLPFMQIQCTSTMHVDPKAPHGVRHEFESLKLIPLNDLGHYAAILFNNDNIGLFYQLTGQLPDPSTIKDPESKLLDKVEHNNVYLFLLKQRLDDLKSSRMISKQEQEGKLWALKMIFEEAIKQHQNGVVLTSDIIESIIQEDIPKKLEAESKELSNKENQSDNFKNFSSMESHGLKASLRQMFTLSAPQTNKSELAKTLDKMKSIEKNPTEYDKVLSESKQYYKEHIAEKLKSDNSNAVKPSQP